MTVQETTVFCILGAVLCLVLKEYQKPQAILLGITVVVVVLLAVMPQVRSIKETASQLFAESSLQPEWFALICKAIGIAWLTQLGTDLCKDCGENAIASAVELCGKIFLAVLSLPLFVTLSQTVLGVIG